MIDEYKKLAHNIILSSNYILLRSSTIQYSPCCIYASTIQTLWDP